MYIVHKLIIVLLLSGHWEVNKKNTYYFQIFLLVLKKQTNKKQTNKYYNKHKVYYKALKIIMLLQLIRFLHHPQTKSTKSFIISVFVISKQH